MVMKTAWMGVVAVAMALSPLAAGAQNSLNSWDAYEAQRQGYVNAGQLQELQNQQRAAEWQARHYEELPAYRAVPYGALPERASPGLYLGVGRR